MINPIVRVLVALVFWLVISAAGSSFYAWHWLNAEVKITVEDKLFTVPSGSNLHRVADSLQDLNLLRWPKVWLGYAKYFDTELIKAGEYQLNAHESPLSLLRRFQAGKVIQYSVALIEGYTLNQALAEIHARNNIQKKLSLPLDLSVDSIDGIDVAHLEGWIYPDTYNFSANDSDVSIISRAHSKMQKVLSEEWDSREKGLPYQNAYEALIMASIIEKETGAASERAQIAGVFVRRLQKKMRLQTDPTVIYGMGDLYDGNIRRADLKRPTAYNTYVIKGLPPTPIALPGRDAIHAALHPKKGDSLYFVARGDGTHVFSATIEEHNAAVRKFQKRRVKNYRSNPAPSKK
ncbi:MAG: UPF0755 protein [Flavobacteriales bacterium]|jgi:UPF0755 protein